MCPGKPGGMTSANIRIGRGDNPAEKFEKVGISLHSRENELIESLPGTLSVLLPRACGKIYYINAFVAENNRLETYDCEYVRDREVKALLAFACRLQERAPCRIAG